MQIRVFSLIVSLSFVLFALAAPSPAANEVTDVAVSKRQLGGLSDILGLLTNAQGLLAPILSTLTGLAGSGGSPTDPLSQIVGIISGLTSSLKGIAPIPLGSAGSADAENAVAQAAGDIINGIGKAISGFPTSLLTLLAFINLDINLTVFLTQLNVIISGILVIIGPIVSVLTTLPGGGAGLGNVLGLLGLL
ncbi:hypothetical protein AURDEDRAFT_184022 [Auricularia subglabra TFB-10046 SS5]|nr:hypothetical protein AURDEDRAFT_184022 [Auricularia subglabra TFB-10046 SS5]